MRTNRTPFYGMPEDRDILPAELRFAVDEMAAVAPEVYAEFSEGAREFVEPSSVLADLLPKAPHPDAVEKGIDLPLGFRQHRGENRKTRRAAVANWQPPKTSPATSQDGNDQARARGNTSHNIGMPTRRELWLQRQRQRRGKLDVETRRLQRERLKQK